MKLFVFLVLIVFDAYTLHIDNRISDFCLIEQKIVIRASLLIRFRNNVGSFFLIEQNLCPLRPNDYFIYQYVVILVKKIYIYTFFFLILFVFMSITCA